MSESEQLASGVPSSADNVYLADFEEALSNKEKRRDVIVVVGAGVSLATTGRADVASWPGLIKNGLTYCLDRGFKPPEWGTKWTPFLTSDDADELVLVAERVQQALTAKGPGVYSEWLNKSIGRLRSTDPSVIQAISALNLPIVTTNYDELIETITSKQAVTWHDPGLFEQVLRGDYPGVAHLHGFFRRPETTILGLESYFKIVNDKPFQELMRAAFRNHTFVFIGCGAGLEDPNLGALRAWLEDVAGFSTYRHFRLIAENEGDDRPLGQHVVPVVYGNYGQLATFLRRFTLVGPAKPRPVQQRQVLDLTIDSEKVLATVRPSGQQATADFNLDPIRAMMVAMLEERLRSRDDSGGYDEKLEARLLGRILFEAIFTGKVAELFERLRPKKNFDGRLSIVLRVAAGSYVRMLEDDDQLPLTSLPWELLYGKNWLSTDQQLTLLRALPGSATDHAEGDTAIDPGTDSAAVTEASVSDEVADDILRVVAPLVQPKELLTVAEAVWPPGKWEAYTLAMDRIRTTLGELKANYSAVKALRIEESPDEDTLRALFTEPICTDEETDGHEEGKLPNVLHYVGFGSQQLMANKIVGVIAVRSNGQETEWETFDQFAERCGGLNLRLVFLHLCQGPESPGENALRYIGRANFAQLARTLLQQGVQVVVAMQYPLLPDHGARFTEKFYESVKKPGTTVGEAVQIARGWATTFYRLGAPVLYISEADDSALVRRPSSTEPDGQQAGIGKKRTDKTVTLPQSPSTDSVAETVNDVVAEVGGAAASPNGDKAVKDVAGHIPPAKAAAEAVAPARDEYGQRTLASLRLLARAVTRQISLSKFTVEPLLTDIWQDCGGGDEPVSVDRIQASIERQQQLTADPLIQEFYQQLSSLLGPHPEDANND